jgi:hypothetical protein
MIVCSGYPANYIPDIDSLVCDAANDLYSTDFALNFFVNNYVDTFSKVQCITSFFDTQQVS